jgi:hypothetical protein
MDTSGHGAETLGLGTSSLARIAIERWPRHKDSVVGRKAKFFVCERIFDKAVTVSSRGVASEIMAGIHCVKAICEEELHSRPYLSKP